MPPRDVPESVPDEIDPLPAKRLNEAGDSLALYLFERLEVRRDI